MSVLDTLMFGIRRVFEGGSELPQRDAIDFRGSGVTAVDNPTTKRSEVTIPGPSGTLTAGQSEVAWTVVQSGADIEILSIAPDTLFSVNQSIYITMDLIARGDGIDSATFGETIPIHFAATYAVMLDTDASGAFTVLDEQHGGMDNGSDLGVSLVFDDKDGTFSINGVTDSESMGWSLFIRAKAYQRVTTQGEDLS